MIRRMVIVLLMAAMGGNVGALELNKTFSDNMVLQRDKPIVIKGTADKGAEVTVEFAGQKKSGKADESGNWVVTLEPIQANPKGQKLTAVSSIGSLKSEIDNVLVGDVFLHARQTSIDISLGRDEEGKKAASSYKQNPMFRAISIKAIPSAKPLSDLVKEATVGWTVVDNASALKMTASAFYLGRDLTKDTTVPIGIIDVNMGPAFANGWLRREALLETGKFFLRPGRTTPDTGVAKDVEQFEASFAAEQKGVPIGKEKVPPTNTLQHPLFPASGYNGTLLPLAGIGLKAVLLQLGNDYPYMRYQEILESSDPFDRKALSDAYNFVYNLRKNGFSMEDKTVPRIPREWRICLGDNALPFGLILPSGSELNTLAQHHREMRELQRLTAEENPGLGVILPGTKHIPFSAQPADDALLAQRCLSWVEGAVYEKPGASATGPLFDRVEANFNEATIYFQPGTAKGLKATGDALKMFEVANVEGDYTKAQATIEGETIKITSDTVTRIARVRYSWSNLPDQGLINAAGLPAIPFRSEKTDYDWFIQNEEDDLPSEYFTPANAWEKKDVTLISVGLQHKGFDNFTGWIGPAGFKTGPFGPNMGVGEIKKGSPADGKLLVNDVIYSANNKMLGNKSWLVMAAAITESETREKKGKLVLGVRRGSENIEVELTLEVMGTYSSTAPYDCPKTEKIVNNLEKWISSGESKHSSRPDFLGTDTLFLLATGNPELLGYARRAIYGMMAQTKIGDKIVPTDGGKVNWYSAWDALVMGEYYMATGDKNVLPYLKFHCDSLAARQHEKGAWRHGYPGGSTYGLMPALGLAGALGFHLANDAGLDINQEAYRKVISYFHDGSGEMGRIIYGVGAGSLAGPRECEPEEMENGLMWTGNGALAAAAVLFDMEKKTQAAHLCSLISAHAWNNTFEGHGGNFWNNFWTPLGAKVHGKKSFINFWTNYRWYRELGRMHDGSFSFDGFKDGAGFGIALVAPRERLQIVGAGPSPFAANAPEILKPVLTAYWNKDYAQAAKLAQELLAGGSVELKDKPTLEYLARASKEMQESFDADFDRMRKLMDAGDLWEAKTFLPGLQGVLKADDPRLVVLQKALADVVAPKVTKEKKVASASSQKWVCLVLEDEAKSAQRNREPKRGPVITTQPQQKPNLWAIKVLEDIKQAPKAWYEPKFDDSGWLKTTLPISWRMYHTALLRTQFDVENKDQFDALRLYSWIMRQQNVQIYLNGELIAKVNDAGNMSDFEQEFKPAALKYLKNGLNTLAIETRHNWRWGQGGLTVYNNGFDFNLDARVKEEK